MAHNITLVKSYKQKIT